MPVPVGDSGDPKTAAAVFTLPYFAAEIC